MGCDVISVKITNMYLELFKSISHLVLKVWVFLLACSGLNGSVGTYGFIHGEAVVDSGRQSDQVSFVHSDSDPPVLFVPDVEVGPAVQDVTDLIVQVQMFLVEHLQLRGRTYGKMSNNQYTAYDLEQTKQKQFPNVPKSS